MRIPNNEKDKNANISMYGFSMMFDETTRSDANFGDFPEASAVSRIQETEKFGPRQA